MAINVVCPKCWSTYRIEARKCAKCKGSLEGDNRRYKVIVHAGGKAKTKTVDNLELARQIEAKYKADAIKFTELNLIEPPIIDDVWDIFYKSIQATTKQPGYYEKFWRVHIKPIYSGKKLDKITATEIDDFTRKLLATERRLRPGQKKPPTEYLSSSTVANVIKLLRRLFKFAIDHNLYTGQNVAEKIPLPKYDNRTTNYLFDDELDRLLRVLREWENQTTAMAFLLALCTGKRMGEIFNLKWDDLDFERKIMKFTVKSRKTGETHIIPMSDISLKILGDMDKIRNQASELIFSTKTGKEIHYNATWARIKKKAELRHIIRPHDLRHTFATRLACSGQVDIYTLQNILGHKTIAMTNRYAHLTDENLKAGMRTADILFKA